MSIIVSREYSVVVDLLIEAYEKNKTKNDL